ncbi:DEKNAAC102067 [Brettanomyces naardenensis]|uniref:Transmembrane 9 superfamily member n=1 Tax=Brettanomyces naardenensis TaxID=13370 RepID=A0A448YJW0_BRENA|nr:DEKNAAC102067 [Brettanomyces naardenensis]
MLLSILTVLLLSVCSQAFYLPGVAPTSYHPGDEVSLFVNHVTPTMRYQDDETKHYMYSYGYYNRRFHFCVPEGGKKKQSESLGSIVFGDRIFNSPFDLKMLENTTCNVMCKSTVPKRDASFFSKTIRAGFQYNWLIDGLPVARQMLDSKTQTSFYSSGFNLGYVDDLNVAHPYNHFSLYVEYHLRSDGNYRVVGVTVMPESRVQADDSAADCSSEDSLPVSFSEDGDSTITYTYSTFWVPSDTVWATRWDKYLHVYDPKIQWFSLINFAIIVVVLSTILVNILLRTLKSDISKYNEVNLDDDSLDEMGWKLISGDVFRPPSNPMILSVILGSGTQILLMALITCGFALLGLLSPSNRGSLSTAMFILYAVLGLPGSYVSGYVYKFFQGEDWRTNMILTPVLVPGVIFTVFVFLNFFLVFAKSSGAVPFGTMVAIIAIWFVVSVPLSCLGSLLAIKAKPIQLPCKVNQIPRQIFPQPWYMRTPFLSLVAGIFPFGAIAIEMYFIYNSLWYSRIYYMFGFLFFCFVLMLITTLLVTLLIVYLNLCNENYKWQWQSLFLGGGISYYIFAHAIILSKFKLGGFISVMMYVGYSLLLAVGVGLMCGTVGFLGSMAFVVTIYRQIKVE